jgi:hypothetical protein
MRSKEARPQFIYCATDGERTKIGSSIDPWKRAKQLCSLMKRDVWIVHIWPLGCRPRGHGFCMEGAVHEQLGRRGWTGKEWYDRPADEVVDISSKCISDLLKSWRRRSA